MRTMTAASTVIGWNGPRQHSSAVRTVTEGPLSSLVKANRVAAAPRAVLVPGVAREADRASHSALAVLLKSRAAANLIRCRLRSVFREWDSHAAMAVRGVVVSGRRGRVVRVAAVSGPVVRVAAARVAKAGVVRVKARADKVD